ncbi:MAG: OmpH family outer membrane protein [Mediterranea sp.]|jgi:outer membrane protein|nr:OmpH family outer membrane protein [Mediterranea sp.]
MRKYVLLTILLFAVGATAQAQRFALIDMEYILQNIPAYEEANTQLDEASKQWQAAVDKVNGEAKSLYETYQTKASTLTDAQRKKQEEAIIAKEKEAANLRQQYFGNDGEMYKKQQELMQPIQDQIYEAVKEIAEQKGYSAVIDRASAMSLIFASPDIDISDEVLARLGYSN